jgi:alkylated DNA repair protein alkB family protein 8
MDSDTRFVKPKGSGTGAESVSRHLYVCGMGDALGSTSEEVVRLFSAYGELDGSESWGAVDMVAGKRFCFVSFVSEADAETALTAMRKGFTDPAPSPTNGAEAGAGKEGRRLQVKYAEKNSACAAAAKLRGPPEPEDTASSDDVVVPGLRIVPDFIDAEEESRLLALFDGTSGAAWEEGISRRVQHYGFAFNYRTIMLDYNRAVPPIPEQCSPLIARMSVVRAEQEREEKAGEQETATADMSASEAPPALPLSQLTINEYEPGQGIAAHIDTFNCFGPDIFVISLQSGITMSLTHRSRMDVVGEVGGVGDKRFDSSTADLRPEHARKKHVWLPPRSLLVLSGEARYEWGHCISSRMNDKVDGKLVPRGKRISLTFRQAFRPNDPPTSLGASHVELDHVFRVYDDIAVHWNHTRGKRKVHWHRVKAFLEALPPGSLLADVGSGDGKYFGLNPGVVCIGCDRSWQLLQVSKQPNCETFCCDVVTLPLTSDSFDATICVAVLHHLASKDRRVAAIRELVRITRPGGTILIQAWALEQEEGGRLHFPEQDVLVPWRLQPRFLQPGQTQQQQGENVEQQQQQSGDGGGGGGGTGTATVSPDGACEHVEEDDNGSLVYKRYCHVYRRGEIEDICSYIPGACVVDTSWDKGNWVVEIRKTEVPVSFLPVNPHKFACPEFVKRAEAAVIKTNSAVLDAGALRVVMPDNRAKKDMK